jgi:hypothetical protein
MTTRNLISATGKWGGRVTAALLVLFWGAFFVEHLSEWFLRGDGRYPPVWVWAQQAFHLGMLVGLALMVRWDRRGALVTVISTIAFFSMIGYRGPVTLPLLNLLPIACFTVYWLARSS